MTNDNYWTYESTPVSPIFKVQLFLESHKNLHNLFHGFDIYLKVSQFYNDLMKWQFLPKYQRNYFWISALNFWLQDPYNLKMGDFLLKQSAKICYIWLIWVLKCIRLIFLDKIDKKIGKIKFIKWNWKNRTDKMKLIKWNWLR